MIKKIKGILEVRIFLSFLILLSEEGGLGMQFVFVLEEEGEEVPPDGGVGVGLLIAAK